MALNYLDVERFERFFNGKFSEKDRDYIRKIFYEKSNEEELEHFARKKWYELSKEDDFKDKSLDHILYRIHYEINTNKPIPKSRKTFINLVKWSARIAAIIILPLSIYSGIHIYRNLDKDKSITWIEINAPAWTRAQFNLPDGSTGWLNGSSSIRYQSNFTKERKIVLDGEAFFNVKTNPEIPFVVSTNEINVTASGTKFNVASYGNEKNVEIVLEEGKLVVSNKEMTSSYTMNPNDLVVYDKSTNLVSREQVEPQIYVAWTEGKLVFRNDPIDVIARRLGRWYNVDVDLSGNDFEDLRLRATFFDENLEEVLYFLTRALPVDYKIITGKFKADDDIYAKKKIIFTKRK